MISALSPSSDPIVVATNVNKVYGRGQTAVHALKEVSVDIKRASFTAIMGPSGSGKSTLMHALAGLDRIDSGTVTVGGTRIDALPQSRLTKFRRDHIGFVFQSFNLIPALNAEENITLPADIAGRRVDQERFDLVVDAMGLRNRLKHRPAELSGGQQQRVACARALVGSPDVLFADEPTGNLDSHSTRQVLTRLRAATDEFSQTVVMVTHEPEAAAYADRVLFLVDGRIIGELRHPTADSVFDALRGLGELTEDEDAADIARRPASSASPVEDSVSQELLRAHRPRHATPPTQNSPTTALNLGDPNDPISGRLSVIGTEKDGVVNATELASMIPPPRVVVPPEELPVVPAPTLEATAPIRVVDDIPTELHAEPAATSNGAPAEPHPTAEPDPDVPAGTSRDGAPTPDSGPVDPDSYESEPLEETPTVPDTVDMPDMPAEPHTAPTATSNEACATTAPQSPSSDGEE
ncbi:MAG: ATP-binding cassette domain-containing protein [Actinomycetaceae bacterium]|nr:ATP-binding cassette domain-containing protein [Actinomycetaceae bacterium]